jgi:hypothetical protein
MTKKNKNNTYYDKIGDMVRKISEHVSQPCKGEHCPIHMKGSVEEWEKEFIGFSFNKGVKNILKSPKDPYEKKIALFELVANIKLKDIEPEESKKVDYLLRSRLYNELAKENYEKYQRATIDEFTKDKKVV